MERRWSRPIRWRGQSQLWRDGLENWRRLTDTQTAGISTPNLSQIVHCSFLDCRTPFLLFRLLFFRSEFNAQNYWAQKEKRSQTGWFDSTSRRAVTWWLRLWSDAFKLLSMPPPLHSGANIHASTEPYWHSSRLYLSKYSYPHWVGGGKLWNTVTLNKLLVSAHWTLLFAFDRQIYNEIQTETPKIY